MRLKLGQYAKRIKKSRYEVLRMIMRGELRYEEVMEGGKKVYYIFVDEEPAPEPDVPNKEVIECGQIRIEIEGDLLTLHRGPLKERYQKV